VARHIVTAVLIVVAMLFALLSVLGIVRSKNNYAALHCLGVTNVMVPPVILIAVLVDTGLGVSSLKMLVLTAIIVLGGPLGSHAIAIAEHRRKPR
jgi:monovalent cation/proton antiporter MnhG/PhaG subunit